MPTSDKFIQSMVELLDKMIENQSKSASLLSEIKSSLAEVRNEQDSILTTVREKIPGQMAREHEENNNRISSITTKIENTNTKLAENMKSFEQDYVFIKSNMDKNSKSLEEYYLLLKELKNIIEKKEQEQEQFKSIIKDIKTVIDAFRSKKAWIALVVAGIAALATMVSAVAGGVESINKFINQKSNQNSAIQTTTTTNPTTTNSNP